MNINNININKLVISKGAPSSMSQQLDANLKFPDI